MGNGRKFGGRAAAGAVAGMLILRLLCPGLFSKLRDLLVDPRGEEAAQAVFRTWSEGADLGLGAVRVFGEDAP